MLLASSLVEREDVDYDEIIDDSISHHAFVQLCQRERKSLPVISLPTIVLSGYSSQICFMANCVVTTFHDDINDVIDNITISASDLYDLMLDVHLSDDNGPFTT